MTEWGLQGMCTVARLYIYICTRTNVGQDPGVVSWHSHMQESKIKTESAVRIQENEGCWALKIHLRQSDTSNTLCHCIWDHQRRNLHAGSPPGKDCWLISSHHQQERVYLVHSRVVYFFPVHASQEKFKAKQVFQDMIEVSPSAWLQVTD